MFLLRPVTDADVPMIAQWLRAQHVQPWFDDADAWLTEIRGRADAFDFIRHFIAMDGETPFAFCQYYDCHDAREDWYTADVPGKTFSIDYMIGAPEYLGKGYGKALVAALSGMVKARAPGAAEIIVRPEAENVRSVRALLANGYGFDGEKGYYRRGL